MKEQILLQIEDVLLPISDEISSRGFKWRSPTDRRTNLTANSVTYSYDEPISFQEIMEEEILERLQEMLPNYEINIERNNNITIKS